MSDVTERGAERSRGENSKGGFGESEKPHPARDKSAEPNLAPPAENANQPTNPGETEGLGEGGRAPDAPVSSGDPQTESDRTDLQ